MRKQGQLIQLGRGHFAVLVGGLLGVLAILWIMFSHDWETLYLLHVQVPRLEKAYGFTSGDIEVHRGTNSWRDWGITSVVHGRRFGRLGVRAGDLPFEHNGLGVIAMCDAIADAERGRFASFDVLNADDFRAGRDEAYRTIALNPPGVERPTPFFGLGGRRELRAPSGARVLENVEPAGDNVPSELWVREAATGARARLYTYSSIGPDVAWSPDERWVAVTENFDGGCVLLDALGGTAAENLSETLVRHDATVRTRVKVARGVRCRVFGWVRGTSRLALIFEIAGGKDGVGFREDLLYDIATHAFSPGR